MTLRLDAGAADLRRGGDLHDPRLLPACAGRHAVRRRACRSRWNCCTDDSRAARRGGERLLAPPRRRRRAGPALAALPGRAQGLAGQLRARCSSASSPSRCRGCCWPAAARRAAARSTRCAAGAAHAAARALWQARARRDRADCCIDGAAGAQRGTSTSARPVAQAPRGWDTLLAGSDALGAPAPAREGRRCSAARSSKPKKGSTARRRTRSSTPRSGCSTLHATAQQTLQLQRLRLLRGLLDRRQPRGCARQARSAASSPSTTCSSTCTSGSRGDVPRPRWRRCGPASRRR